jgi:hypothetical protein
VAYLPIYIVGSGLVLCALSFLGAVVARQLYTLSVRGSIPLGNKE